jgi:siroheme synthase (precorrin-2 oxidase/ferrochelatase)
MYMPLMVDVKRAVVFAGERGEGLQKTQKLALFADELLVVSEAPPSSLEIVLPAGRQSELNEALALKAERRVPIHPVRAADADLDALIAGATFVTSDLADRQLNERIAAAARRHHVLCNIIDTRDLCDTWFMSLIETDHLIAGLSTKATATYYVTRLRRELEPRFVRWEKEAAFTALAREQLVPQRRFSGLKRLWASRWIRTVLRWGGPQAALRSSRKRIVKENNA